MAVNFENLPPEEPEPDEPPSRFVWTIVFFVIVLAGVFAVLLLWPKDEPTQSLWFWICVTVYPVGVAAFVVLRRYSVFEGRRLDAIAWNEAREKYVTGVFEQASRPLVLLAAAYRFASDAKEDAFDKLLGGSIKLEPRTVPGTTGAAYFDVAQRVGGSGAQNHRIRCSDWWNLWPDVRAAIQGAGSGAAACRY
ncbi:hypothetical protein [Burkholderia sp. BE17]|uniref:hypothetical protein n=1 Tax=Burkholderia sp. BE17 TaxID=2656644 RepID=UPI001D117E7B|nr:hypothetical protein [Burkholderia sp. BE17]